MATLIGVRGPLTTEFDCYATVDAAAFPAGSPSSWPPVLSDDEIASVHLLLVVKQTDNEGAGEIEEVTYDSANVVSTHPAIGHPGVIGIHASGASVTGTTSGEVLSFDPTKYVAPAGTPNWFGHS